jgi:plastocyanin domain-containing protein
MKLAFILLALTTQITFAKDKTPEKNVYKLVVTEKGFEPDQLKVQANTPVTLKITRKTNQTCAREITVPAQNIKTELPMNREVTVRLAALPKGEIKFGCGMNMMVGGVMVAE